MSRFDRLARSVPDVREIACSLAAGRIGLQRGATVHTPMGKPFFQYPSKLCPVRGNPIRMRTREGTAVARAKGKLRGKRPRLSDRQQEELHRLHDSREYPISDPGGLYSISRPTVCRT